MFGQSSGVRIDKAILTPASEEDRRRAAQRLNKLVGVRNRAISCVEGLDNPAVLLDRSELDRKLRR